MFTLFNNRRSLFEQTWIMIGLVAMIAIGRLNLENCMISLTCGDGLPHQGFSHPCFLLFEFSCCNNPVVFDLWRLGVLNLSTCKGSRRLPFPNHFPARGRKRDPRADPRCHLLEGLSQPLPRKGTETPFACAVTPHGKYLSQPLPRKGTETWSSESDSQSKVSNLSQPLPRKGTETPSVFTLSISICQAFPTTSPQGDGNPRVPQFSTHPQTFPTTSPQGDGNIGQTVFQALPQLPFPNHFPARGRKPFL